MAPRQQMATHEDKILHLKDLVERYREDNDYLSEVLQEVSLMITPERHLHHSSWDSWVSIFSGSHSKLMLMRGAHARMCPPQEKSLRERAEAKLRKVLSTPRPYPDPKTLLAGAQEPQRVARGAGAP